MQTEKLQQNYFIKKLNITIKLLYRLNIVILL